MTGRKKIVHFGIKINLRISKKQNEYLETKKINKAEYVRLLIDNDINTNIF